MNVCSFTELRAHLRRRLDELHQTKEPLLVTRQNAPSAVLLDKEEYDGLMETLHLLKSPVNAQRLMRSIAQAEASQVVAHPLEER
ncbi:MAG: type II toxin-antitoxin system Phd/YefM family antitoxin [Rhodospirillales bacterium]|nr:type II toxin-antitoxin system Phd/YefM family antitoxin [Rhodospirillales bacterium]